MDNRPIYRTAVELGILDWEHAGLAALVGPLSRSEIPIDMKRSCGTIGCIGGRVAYNAPPRVCSYRYVAHSASDALIPLYYPGGGVRKLNYIEALNLSHSAWKATAPQAAKAIVNFLVTGDPQWDAVMAAE